MHSFHELGLKENILQALNDLGFETPTPIQTKAIPVLISGTKDFVGLAQTGTGKTAAFGLPLIQLVDEDKRHPQALIVCPTRELCVQINNDLKSFRKYSESIDSEAVYGGTSISVQIKTLKKGIQIIAATPGRLIDLIERKAIDLNKVKYVVLDEADEMLNMGFRDDIDFILDNTPNRESVWLFSATMPNEVRSIASRFMTSPFEVTIGKKNAANSNIDHQYFVMAAHHRYDALKRLIDFNPEMYGIVFTRTKAGAQDITEKLTKDGYAIEALHGDLSQQQRDRVMKKFRNKTTQLLVATDVAARGIDVDSVTHVINYELPDDPEVYTHRSGRTGRAGKNGLCFSLCHSREISRIHQIENLIKTTIKKMELPDASDVSRKKLFHFMDTLLQSESGSSEVDVYISEIISKFEHISKEEILKKIAILELSSFLEYYADAEDLNVRKTFAPAKNAKPASGKFERRQGGYTRLFINVGTKDGFHKSNFLQFLLNESGLRNASIGKIELKEMNSWVEVENGLAGKMIGKLNGRKYKNRNLRMNEANSVSKPQQRRNFKYN